MTRNRSIGFIAGAIAPVLVAMAVSAAVANGGTQSSSATATVALRSTSLGKVLADARGRTLYLFLKDSKGQSLCDDSCAQYWPPLLSTGKPRAGAGVHAPLLGVITRKDGQHQVTYAGHPLYTFVSDTKPGQTDGEGSTNFGAAWYAVGANGSAVKSAIKVGDIYGP